LERRCLVACIELVVRDVYDRRHRTRLGVAAVLLPVGDTSETHRSALADKPARYLPPVLIGNDNSANFGGPVIEKAIAKGQVEEVLPNPVERCENPLCARTQGVRFYSFRHRAPPTLMNPVET
jgi:hypothetical protein